MQMLFARHFSRVIALTFLLIAGALAQTAAPPLSQPPQTQPQPAPAKPQPTQPQTSPPQDQAQSPAQPDPQNPAPQKNEPPRITTGPQPEGQQIAEPDSKISKEEADELFRSVDEILRFASQDTGLPIKHRVKRELASREQVQKFIEERLKDDEETQRLRRSELVLKKFGLLPPTFELQKFLVALLREQVAGFYDPKRKTVYLLDWVAPEAQKAVLAHELTHALQDQNYDLEKWAKGAAKGTKRNAVDVESDERLAARHAVMEGQAMAVLLDYMLAPTGQSLLSAPLVVQAVQHGMTEGSSSPVFARAPLYLKQSLTFPYREGLNFVREVLEKSGKARAFGGVFREPPQDTRQVMEPQTYLVGQSVPPMFPPDLAFLKTSGYEQFDVGGIGEFDIKLLLRQYGKQETGDVLAPQWRGGYYYAGRKRGDNSGPLGLLFVTRFASAEAASQFAAAFDSAVPQRYPSARKVTAVAAQAPANETKTQTLKLLVPGESQADAGRVTIGIAPSLTAPSTWTSDEGRVTIMPRGDIVVVVEDFDPETAHKLLDAASAAAGLK